MGKVHAEGPRAEPREDFRLRWSKLAQVLAAAEEADEDLLRRQFSIKAGASAADAGLLHASQASGGRKGCCCG
jgi:hypothetical protein